MSYKNPSIEQINEWAYSGQVWPIEEWDLFLSWTGEVDLFIALATDHKCPSQSFFLHMLYYIVGTTYTSHRMDEAQSRIAVFADKGRKVEHGEIRKWVGEVDALLRGAKKYEYLDWRGGRLAKYQFT